MEGTQPVAASPDDAGGVDSTIPLCTQLAEHLGGSHGCTLPAWHDGPHNSTNLRGRTRLQAAAAAVVEDEDGGSGGEYDAVVLLEDAVILEAQVRTFVPT